MRRAVFLGAVAVPLSMSLAQLSAQTVESNTDLYSLILVESDLGEATRAMTVYDTNDDRFIDDAERKRLPWKEEATRFDLNRDGKLTHLEVALRVAMIREEKGITQFDINNVNTFMGRYDANRNGQLDPDEISRGWPSQPQDYDENNDGILTVAELATRFAFNRGLRREMGIEAIDQTGAVRIVRQLDRDGDKMLDADERKSANLPKAAKEFDENSDGKLGIMEIATMFAKHRMDTGLTKPDQAKVRRLFERFDPDRDGKIEFEGDVATQFDDSLKQQLGQYDTDGDGAITVSEVEQVVAASRKEKGYVEVDFKQAVSLMTRHDKDRSTFLEASELPDTASSGMLSAKTMGQADLDDDDRISLDELARFLAAQRERE